MRETVIGVSSHPEPKPDHKGTIVGLGLVGCAVVAGVWIGLAIAVVVWP